MTTLEQKVDKIEQRVDRLVSITLDTQLQVGELEEGIVHLESANEKIVKRLEDFQSANITSLTRS